jgi:hypothetical protein
MPTFHNTRWPLLTTLLKEKGWTEAKEGEVADLSFADAGAWRKEKDSKKKGKIQFFSRIYTDLLSNKRSCVVGLKSGGCIPDVMPVTFTDVKLWEKHMSESNENDLWFFKAKNASNSKGISVARNIEEGRSILALHSAGGNKVAAQDVLAITFDDAFLSRFSSALNKAGHSVPVETLRSAFNGALCSDENKLQKAMKNYVIQRGVRNPLLIKEGRKFCLRIYVLAYVRPLNKKKMNHMVENEKKEGEKQEEKMESLEQKKVEREIEVYVSTLEIARPQKSPFDPGSIDPAAQYQDSSTLYASISDGSCYPVDRWNDHQFPKIKESVKRVMTDALTLHDAKKHEDSVQYKAHFAYEILHKSGATPEDLNSKDMHDQGRIAMMGWDFMIDESDKPWLIEINAICNLHHSANSERDTFNKTKLAEAFYDTVLADEPKKSEYLHRVL